MSYSIDKTEVFNLTNTYRQFCLQGGASSSQAAVNVSRPFKRSGTAVAGYEKRIATQVDASSDYSVERVFLKVQPYVAYHFETNAPQPIYTLQECTGIVVRQSDLYKLVGRPLASVTDDNTAKNRLYSDILEQRNSAQVSIMLAEMKGTKELLLDRNKSLLAKLIQAKKHGHWMYRRARFVNRLPYVRTVKILSEWWLTYAFGLKPLAQDIDDLWSLYTEKVHERNVIARGSCTETKFIKTADTIGGVGLANWTFSHNTHTKRRYRYVYCFTVRPNLPAQAGLTAAGALEGAWNAIPWSFLVDYFVNIGDFLEYNTLCSIPPIYATRSELLSGIAHTSGTARRLHDIDQVISPGYGVTENVKFQRTAIHDLPVPQLNITIPGVGSLKYLNIAALIASRFNTQPYK